VSYQDAISGLATLAGMLAAFGSVFFLGLLWWLRRSSRHNIILESLFLAMGAIWIRQLVTVLIHGGYLGPVGSLGRLIARHALTGLYFAVSMWVLVRMLYWLRQDDDTVLIETERLGA